MNSIPGRKAIVLFTDGVDIGSGLADGESTLIQFQESSVPVYVIHYDTQQSYAIRQPAFISKIVAGSAGDLEAAYIRAATFLRNLSEASGGRLYRAASVDRVAEAFSGIAEDLAHQYTLTYYPSNRARDGSLRRIHVQIDRPRVQIRARTAYRAGAQPKSEKHN